MDEKPTGTVSFVFTDIEGSTKLLRALGRDRYEDMLREHQRLLRGVWSAHDGYEVDAEGDAFFVAFARPSAALAAAADAQRALSRARWPEEHELRVRIGVHSGEASVQTGKYVGVAVHRAARVSAAAHGGQVLVSEATASILADEDLPEGVALRDLGQHRLKDLTEPQRLFQLVMDRLPTEFPPPKTLENQQTNLPVQQTALIGREREIEDVGTLLRREDLHLVTLTGTGGTGKTRLALQVAAEAVEEFSDGVFFVSLAPIADSDLVVPTIAQSLGVRGQAGERLLDSLTEYLRERQLLLLLDNFEQVAQAASSLASLLGSSPGLKLLVTSRTPVHISGEQTYDVPPLALPDVRRLPRLETLAQVEAVALFIERAQAAKSGFLVTNENAPAIAEICIGLDGLPLALELAAARIRALPPQTLLARLDQRLKLLTGGAQDLDERQRTLRATIEWSYELLSQEERALFARLGVFVGGCRLDAAEEVCDPDRELGIDLLDGLTSLVDKSLLRQREDTDGEPRYWMLATIREFAQERFEETGEADAVRGRHGEHFLRVSEDAARHLERGEELSVLNARLEEDHSNLRAALAYWRGEPDVQLALANALWDFWYAHGHWRELRHWADEALEGTSPDTPQRLRALEATYYPAYLRGDTVRARMLLDEMLVLARRLKNRSGIADALHGLALLATNEGDYEGAVALEEESLSLCQGEHFSLFPTSGLGAIALLRNDLERARTYFERSLAISRTFRNDHETAHDLAMLSTVAAFAGDEQEALTLLRESIALARKIDSRPTLARRSLPALAALRYVQGDLEGAVRLIAASEALLEEMVGFPGGPLIRVLSQRILESAQSKLEGAQLAVALEEGRALTLDEALAYASGR